MDKTTLNAQLVTSRDPTWGSAAPGRVEKCRPPTVSGVTRGLSQGENFMKGAR